MEIPAVSMRTRLSRPDRATTPPAQTAKADFGDLLARATRSSTEAQPANAAPAENLRRGRMSPQDRRPAGARAPYGSAAALPTRPATASKQPPAKVAETAVAGADLSSQLERAFHPPPEPQGAVWSGLVDGPARLSSEYGMRRDPFTHGWRFHEGIDIAAPTGTPVRPIRDGVVTFSGWKGGFGRVVVVQHEDGVETAYGHNASNLVRAGDRVTTETELARVGSTGRSTGPHLHFEVRKDGKAVDPVPYLEGLF